MKESIIELKEMERNDLVESLGLVKLILEGIEIDRFLLDKSPQAMANELHYAAALKFCDKLRSALIIESVNSNKPGYPERIKVILNLLKKTIPRNLNELSLYLADIINKTTQTCFLDFENNEKKQDVHMCRFF